METADDEHHIPKVNVEPKYVLDVKIVAYRNISLGAFHDHVVDTPDPYIKVHCPWLDKKNAYKTLTKNNVTTAEVNETFRFVIPQQKLGISQPVEIYVYDNDGIHHFFDDLVGEHSCDVSEIKLNDTLHKTFHLQNNRGELDVVFSKYVQKKPDIRLSQDICDGEKKFLGKRMPKVKEAIKRFLADENPVLTEDQTPKISVVGSGGGYRAAIGMSGGMAALKDAGLLDALTYTSGLSGSAWYLTSAYANGGMRAESQMEYHEWLKSRMEESPGNNLISFYYLYCSRCQSVKEAYDQPTSPVDFFGYLIGEKLLGEEKMHQTLSGLGKDVVQTGDVPYPILTSIHAKDNLPASQYHVFMENTPHEISMPRYGVNIATKHFGSHWDEGIVTRECPEFPLHYYIGSCGCAFSILLSHVDSGSEMHPKLIQLVDEIRKDSVTSLIEDIVSKCGGRSRKQESVEEDTDFSFFQSFANLFKNTHIVEDRNSVIERTSAVINFAHNFQPIQAIQPELRRDASELSEFHREIMQRLGHRKLDSLSTNEENLSVLDAGIVKNVSVECCLRSSRQVDVIIVFDMNRYESDDSFSYMPIILSAAHAWRDGLPFPPINVKELVNAPPKELLVFEGDTEDCPIVLWFTLCNKSFKELKNYHPKTPFDAVWSSSVSSSSKPFGFETMNGGRPFNDFPVHNKGNNYSTYNFCNSRLQFEQLHELMYHNVSTHIAEIREQISKAVNLRKVRQVNGL